MRINFFKSTLSCKVNEFFQLPRKKFFTLSIIEILQTSCLLAQIFRIENCQAMPSTVISSYEYQPENKVLRITFVSGLIYEYLNVEQATFDEFKKAFSKGIHFNKFIKPNHPARKIG